MFKLQIKKDFPFFLFWSSIAYFRLLPFSQQIELLFRFLFYIPLFEYHLYVPHFPLVIPTYFPISSPFTFHDYFIFRIFRFHFFLFFFSSIRLSLLFKWVFMNWLIYKKRISCSLLFIEHAKSNSHIIKLSKECTSIVGWDHKREKSQIKMYFINCIDSSLFGKRNRLSWKKQFNLMKKQSSSKYE